MKNNYLKQTKNFLLLAVLFSFFTSCGAGTGSGSGSQDYLIPTNIPQNGVLGSWYLQSGNLPGINKNDTEPNPVSTVEVDVFTYIESDRFTVVTKCTFEDGSKLTAVVSSRADLSDSPSVPDVKDLHAFDRKVSRVVDGDHWCTSSITPSTMHLQLESNFTLRMWNDSLTNVFLSRIE